MENLPTQGIGMRINEQGTLDIHFFAVGTGVTMELDDGEDFARKLLDVVATGRLLASQKNGGVVGQQQADVAPAMPAGEAQGEPVVAEVGGEGSGGA